jgi:glycosyltransferase involved in cell wall biosynthesis
MIAQVLKEDGARVDLLGHEATDPARLARHLGLDLDGITYRRIPDRGDAALADVSADYALFVNSTYGSRLAPKSRRAAYLCFFPTPPDHDLDRWRRTAVRVLGPTVRGLGPDLDFGLGWFPPEGGRRRHWTWTTDEAVLSLPAGPRGLQVDLGRPGAPGPAQLTIVDDDQTTLADVSVSQDFVPHRFDFGAREAGSEIRFRTQTFVPGGNDSRELGVALSRPRLPGIHGPRGALLTRAPWLRRDPRDLDWLQSYATVMANSEYTRGYVRSYWHTEADVLYPPIRVHTLQPLPGPQREQAVLSVGRFFAPGLGHAKRQLEMVQAFGELYRGGQLPGWKMYVVGGMEASQQPYVARVRAAAEGLPVEIIPNATREHVEQLLARCAIFWSATGYGEDVEKRPWNAEHFGMTTAEAMAGGCVPVVIDQAGQREIVRDGLDGYRWTTLEELGHRTALLAQDASLRARLSGNAQLRAASYDEVAFRTRWRQIVAQHDLL